MSELLQAMQDWGASELGTWLRAGLMLTLGLPLAGVLARAARRLVAGRLDPQRAMIAQRVVGYALITLVLVSSLGQLGFDLSVLVGAAGILTVAVGFASQTAASNLISGVFLMGEAPFVVGDVIRVGTTTGEVTSIDSLSVKLRTFDNLLVRLPNESLLKTELTNLTHYPIRRLDVAIGVASKEDVERVREVLMAVADANPLCLEEPAPLFIFLGFGDSALTLQHSVWAERGSFMALRNSIHPEIKAAFDAAGIEIPFPHRTLYAGSATAPFPVRVVRTAPEEPRS